MQTAFNIRFALCLAILAMATVCVSGLSAHSSGIDTPASMAATTSVETRACDKLTIPVRERKKCGRVTVVATPATGRLRPDDADLSLFSGNIGGGILVEVSATTGRQFSLTADPRSDPGGRAPFWTVFATAPRLRN